VQLFPTRSTVHVAVAALGAIAVGMAARLPAAVAWGGAMIAGLAWSHAMTRLSILHLRAAGLEMIWQASRRVRHVARGAVFEVTAELNNRDAAPVRYIALRAVASSELDVEADRAEGTLYPGETHTVRLSVRAPRVGRLCIHGLALEVRGPLGLFEVPLAFANPIGIHVTARPFAALSSSARGGRSRVTAAAGAPDPHPGPGTELYELRDHVSGDPFKRIAWKASARRGRLMVRELEREDRDVVWIVLDAAVELWGGPLGRAPLDYGIDEVAAIAQRHLSRGDRVGLAVVGASPRSWLSPARGPAHGMRIADLLLTGTSTLDADRSDYDETEVARRVLDHLRFLDAGAVAALRLEQLESLQTYAEMQRARAPYDAPAPWAPTPREQSLRRYLACSGISSPPRLGSDRARAMALLIEALERALTDKPRPSLVYVWSPPPEGQVPVLAASVRKLLRRGIGVRWIPAPIDRGVEPGPAEMERIAAEAVVTRARVARERGERLLLAMGVRLARKERRLPE
jgi:uncharacterized protein (DUF58 family)